MNKLDVVGVYGGKVTTEVIQAPVSSVSKPIRAVVVGDSMRISVALLKQIYDSTPEHVSVLVTLTDVRVEADGSKTLVLERIVRHGKA